METEQEKQNKQFLQMTTEPVEHLLLRLSIPTIISMMITNIYNLADTAFVGTLGTSQSGATGVVFATGKNTEFGKIAKILNVEIYELFEFSHQKDKKALIEEIIALLNSAPEEKIKTSYKVIKSIIH